MTDDVRARHCGKCGAAFSANDIFCAKCGAVLSAYASPSGAEAPEQPETLPVEPAESTAPAPATDPRSAPGRLTPPTDDWRELFSRPVVPPDPSVVDAPVAEPADPPAPRSTAPQPRSDQQTRARTTKPTERVDSSTPAESRPTARRTAEMPKPAASAANTAPAPSGSSRSVFSTQTMARRSGGLPNIVLAGIALSVLSCLLFGLTAAIGESGAGPAFAIFCLFPIGIVMVAAGLVRMVKQNRNGDQEQS